MSAVACTPDLYTVAAEADTDEDEDIESGDVSGAELFSKGTQSLHVKIFL